MIRKTFKRNRNKPRGKLDKLIEKYKLPKEYLAINRKSISRGVLIGLFWGFIPMPFQMAGVLLITPFLRFNVPIAISMVWLSNPLTMPAMYYMEYLTGNYILGRDGIESVELTMYWFKHHWDDIIIPLYTGAAFYSIVVSSVIYGIINLMWIRSVRNEKENKINRSNIAGENRSNEKKI